MKNTGRLAATLGAMLMLAATAACNQSSAPVSKWNVTDHVPLDQFIVQSHRGAGFLAEENTIESFEIGWKHGTIPEADVRTTKDGVIVSFHDKNFKRVVKDASPELAKQGVEDVTYDFLSKLDVGSWKGDAFVGRRTPKMSELFEMIRNRPERGFYLDIKTVDLKQLAALVKEYGVAKQVIFTSSKPELHAEWKKLVPESETLLWMRGDEARITKLMDELEKTNFEGLTQMQLHIFPNKDKKSGDALAEPFTHSREFIIKLGERMRRHGINFQTLPYTDDPTVYATLLDLGVQSFATDYPDVTMREIKAYYAGKKKAAR